MAVASSVVRLPAWRRCVPDAAALRVPDEFVARMDAGGCLVVAGRNSSSDGKQGRRAAVDDLYGAAEQLALATGIDVRPFLPGKEELLGRLAEAEAHTSTTLEGATFRNRYVVVDERARAGVVFVVSTGSGHLLDEDGEQPFVRYVARLVRRYDALVFACKRLDRGAREDWGAAPLMIALRQRDAYLFDEDGLGKIDTARGVTSFVKGGGSRKVADDMPYATRSGQRTLSGTEMRGGRARYHVSVAPPPGFGTAWLRGGGGTPTERVVYLDCDQARPSDAEVAYGLPEVYTDGEQQPRQRVDQVENVRFVLSAYGKPGWTVRRLVAEMARRRLSTPRLRGQHGPSAAVPNEPYSARQVIETVIANLEVYETGVLRRELGAGVAPLEITGCWPPDGKPWATAEDFERIRAHRRDRDARMAKAVRLTFAGTAATYNGTPVRMTTGRADPRRPGERELRYQFALEAAYPWRQRKPDGHIPLPWEAFARSLVDAFAAAGEAPVPLASAADLQEEADDGLAELRADQASTRHDIEELQRRLAVLRTRLEDTDEHGEPVLTGALLREVQATYNRIAEQDLPAAQQRHHTLAAELEQRSATRQATAHADAALVLVQSLRQPTDRSFRHLWLESIHNLKFHAEAITRDGRHGKRLSWTGALRLAHGDDVVLLPFRGAHETGAAATTQQRAATLAEQAVADMAAGTPYPHTSGSRRTLHPARVARLLGADPDRFLLASCHDPRITRVAVACHQRPNDPDQTIADDLDVDPPLVRRVRQTHTGEDVPTSWLQPRSRAEVAFYALAAAHDGHVTAQHVADLLGCSKGTVYTMGYNLRATTPIWSTQRKRGYLIHPCDCGSTARALLRIPEPHGPVCRHCHHDLAGAHWPPDPYEHYLAHPDLWHTTGWPHTGVDPL